MTADSVTSVGYSMVINNNEIPYKSDTIEKNYDFPIQFGNTTYSRGYTKTDMNPVYNGILKQHRVHSSSVDGWGSITTPYGTFNALRIKHEINPLFNFFDKRYITCCANWCVYRSNKHSVFQLD